jgi:hypothetical protein
MSTTCTEMCRICTDHGEPVSLTVGGEGMTVPHHGTPAADVAEALAALGYEVLGRLCWVDRTLSILAVRRRS